MLLCAIQAQSTREQSRQAGLVYVTSGTLQAETGQMHGIVDGRGLPCKESARALGMLRPEVPCCWMLQSADGLAGARALISLRSD